MIRIKDNSGQKQYCTVEHSQGKFHTELFNWEHNTASAHVETKHPLN